MILHRASFFNFSTVVVLSMLFLLSGCGKKQGTFVSDDSSPNPVTTVTSSSQSGDAGNDPTGLSSGMISPPQVRIKGIVYVYHYNGRKERLNDDYEIIGTINDVNDYEIPKDDCCAGGRELDLQVGQEILGLKQNDSVIAVKCEDGYYMFYKE